MNVNVGVMGHVDSGKTSLVGALSTCLSTCALDKHPQSKQRGITLDLGFSSFRSVRRAEALRITQLSPLPLPLPLSLSPPKEKKHRRRGSTMRETRGRLQADTKSVFVSN